MQMCTKHDPPSSFLIVLQKIGDLAQELRKKKQTLFAKYTKIKENFVLQANTGKIKLWLTG